MAGAALAVTGLGAEAWVGVAGAEEAAMVVVAAAEEEEEESGLGAVAARALVEAAREVGLRWASSGYSSKIGDGKGRLRQGTLLITARPVEPAQVVALPEGSYKRQLALGRPCRLQRRLRDAAARWVAGHRPIKGRNHVGALTKLDPQCPLHVDSGLYVEAPARVDGLAHAKRVPLLEWRLRAADAGKAAIAIAVARPV
jgi:hypothetical protein